MGDTQFMNPRAFLVAGFGLGLVLSFSQACVTKFECIYIYVHRPKLCASLFPVPTAEGGGLVAGRNGEEPAGCACLPYALGLTFNADPTSPDLDEVYEAIQIDARAQCVLFATNAGQDPGPCQSAMLDKGSAYRTNDQFKECEELIATIDEDRDGVCDSLDGGTDGTETGDETGDDGGVVLPDLGFGAP